MEGGREGKEGGREERGSAGGRDEGRKGWREGEEGSTLLHLQ